MKRTRAALLILLIAVASLTVLYYLDNFGPLSRISITEAIFEDVEELAFLDSYAIEELQPQNVGLHALEAYYSKLIGYEQNEYLVAGYRFNNSKDALRFFQQDIKQANYNEEFDPAWMPFTWHASHKKGEALFGLIAQEDVLLIKSSTANLNELAQFQNWMATFLSKELIDPSPHDISVD